MPEIEFLYGCRCVYVSARLYLCLCLCLCPCPFLCICVQFLEEITNEDEDEDEALSSAPEPFSPPQPPPAQLDIMTEQQRVTPQGGVMSQEGVIAEAQPHGSYLWKTRSAQMEETQLLSFVAVRAPTSASSFSPRVCVCVYVCVCVWLCACACDCGCLCVREREGEKQVFSCVAVRALVLSSSFIPSSSSISPVCV